VVRSEGRSGGADAAYVHISYDLGTIVKYEFAKGGSNPGELQIPRDCCCGYCLSDATGDRCGCEPPSCSKVNQKCETAAGGCAPENAAAPPLQCIGGFCGFIRVE
jgi:hypothetical protein